MFKLISEGMVDPDTSRMMGLILQGKIVPDQPIEDPEVIEVVKSYLHNHGVPALVSLQTAM